MICVLVMVKWWWSSERSETLSPWLVDWCRTKVLKHKFCLETCHSRKPPLRPMPRTGPAKYIVPVIYSKFSQGVTFYFRNNEVKFCLPQRNVSVYNKAFRFDALMYQDICGSDINPESRTDWKQYQKPCSANSQTSGSFWIWVKETYSDYEAQVEERMQSEEWPLPQGSHTRQTGDRRC